MDTSADPTSGLPEFLYHYTRAEGLLGILSERAFWASNLRFLNDSSEHSFGSERIRSRLKSAESQVAEQRRRNGEPSRARDVHRDLELSSDQLYVVSLTEGNDDLAQWRAYGRGGGYSIRLPFAMLTGTKTTHAPLHRCVYGSEQIDERVDKLVSRLSSPSSIAPQESDISASDEFVQVANLLCATTKNPSFRAEREWRVVIRSRRDGSPPVEFRTRGGVIVPYVVHRLPEFTSDLWGAVQVTVGPGPQQSLCIDGIQQFLSSKGLASTVAVERSSIPYRDMD